MRSGTGLLLCLTMGPWLISGSLPAQGTGALVYRFTALRNGTISRPAQERSFAELIELGNAEGIDQSDFEELASPRNFSERASALITLTPVDSAGGVLWRVLLDSLLIDSPLQGKLDKGTDSNGLSFTIYQRDGHEPVASRVRNENSDFFSPLASDIMALLASAADFQRNDSTSTLVDQRGGATAFSDLSLAVESRRSIQDNGDTLHAQITRERNFWDSATGITLMRVEREDWYRLEGKSRFPVGLWVQSRAEMIGAGGNRSISTFFYSDELRSLTLITR